MYDNDPRTIATDAAEECLAWDALRWTASDESLRAYAEHEVYRNARRYVAWEGV